MSKKIAVGDVITANKDITSWLRNVADKGEEGFVVGTNEDKSLQVLFRGEAAPIRVEAEEVSKAKAFKIKAKNLALGMKVRIEPYNVWVKLSELSLYDDRVYAEGEDKTGQSHADEFGPDDFVEVKA